MGELVDKITILQIKSENIKDPEKLKNIRTELETLLKTLEENVPASEKLEALKEKLLEINKQLWDIEDAIRDKERDKCFDKEFIEIARSVYYTNDERCRVKRKINDGLLRKHDREMPNFTSQSIHQSNSLIYVYN